MAKKSTSLVVALRDENEVVTGFADQDGKEIAMGSGGSGVTSVSVTAPLTKTGSTATPTLAIPAATSGAAGHMTAAHATTLAANTATLAAAGSANGLATLGADGYLSAAQRTPHPPTQITASRAVVATDDGNTLYNTSASDYTLTVNSGMPSNFGFSALQKGTGKLIIAAGAGVTISNLSSFTKTAGQHAMIGIVQGGADANTYTLIGQGAV